MYFDRRLWQYTEGLRLRIAGAVLLGLLSAAVGIARLALLGWLLGRVFKGEGFDELVLPIVAVAVAMVARGVLEYWRTMEAHRTAAMVQLQIRARLFDQIAALGPGQFGAQRSGDALLTLIDGVEQLETYFGQYLPQLFRCRSHAFRNLRLCCLSGPAARRRPARLRPAHPHRPRGVPPLGPASGEGAAGSLCGLRRRAFGFGARAGGHSRPSARARRGVASSRRRPTTSSAARCGCWRATRPRAASPMPASPSARRQPLGSARPASPEGAIGIEVLLIVLMMGVEVFRPMRDLRALLHTGMNGRAAAESPVPPAGHEACHRRRGKTLPTLPGSRRPSPSKTCISLIRAGAAPPTTGSRSR